MPHLIIIAGPNGAGKTTTAPALLDKALHISARNFPMKNRRKEDEEIAKLFNDPDKLTIIIQSGIRDALLKHKQAGNPICEWRNNKIVWISAENILDIKPDEA